MAALLTPGCGGEAPEKGQPSDPADSTGTEESTGTDPTETGDPGGTEVEGDGAVDFISHVLGQSNGSGLDAATGASVGTGGTSAAAPEANDAAAGDAERAISEADILKLEGDTLYALSQYTGMTIIDISTPSDLRVLGTYRSTATPFEMYLEGGTAYVMYSNYSYYAWDEAVGGYVNRSTSRMQALDVSDPAAPRVLGEKELPGEISDSRKVGNIVYVVTHQTSYCWDCDTVANTRISSFDVSDPATFNPVDEERFVTEDESWGRRSVSVSSDRMYVSGWSWNSDSTVQTGSIQVVDISDPAGQIEPGAVVPLSGMITNRWQMDEYEGVLRVISQPGGWSSITEPVVETFAIASSTELTPLGRLPMVLPMPESLQSVRFDGDRAFAVTFQQTDPLFTFDLSDPANPVQVGELEIPGFLYHMEPRGDRLYALGFDQSVDNGALHVSIFDVSTLSSPTMLDRVNFGGDWAWLAEDQDRVHKLFNLALDQQLILLPYSGGAWDESTCYYGYGSGIQIIDAVGDDLTLRGVAPQVGTARRALLHNDVLFGISDDAVQSFDISDRDNPRRLDRQDVAHNVSQIKVMGDDLLRFGQNWWTEEVELDLVSLENAEQAESTRSLDLTSLSSIRDKSCTDGSYSSSSFQGQVFTHGSFAYLPRTTYESGSNADGTWYSRDTMWIEIVDLGADAAPRIVGEIALEPTSYDSVNGQSSYYAGFVQTDRALMVGRSTGYYSYDPETGARAEPTFAYDIIDLDLGADARVVRRLQVPELLAQGGWGYGFYGCMVDMAWGWWGGWGYYGASSLGLVSGDIVASQHEVPVEDGTGRVRYYLDRIDMSDPAAPVFLDPVNIPGQVVRYDHDLGRIVTMDYDPETLEAGTNADLCNALGRGATFQYDQAYLAASGYDYTNAPGICTRWHRRVHSLVLEGDVATRVSLLDLDAIDSDGIARTAQEVAVTSSRIFYQRWAYGENTWQRVDPQIVALGFAPDGKLSDLGSIEPEVGEMWGSLVARDKRAFLSAGGMMEIITSENGQPLTSEVHELRSWGCYADSLEVTTDQVLCAQGQYGVQSIPLD